MAAGKTILLYQQEVVHFHVCVQGGEEPNSGRKVLDHTYSPKP